VVESKATDLFTSRSTSSQAFTRVLKTVDLRSVKSVLGKWHTFPVLILGIQLKCPAFRFRVHQWATYFLSVRVADFADESITRRNLYQAAIQLSLQNCLLTYTARIAFARLLLEDFDDRKGAQEQLIACESEMMDHADKDGRQEWSELLAQSAPRAEGLLD
jgi:hypothetical protein